MGRTRTGKTHNGQVRVTQKNGDVYVYERVTAYNPDTMKTYTVKKTLIGKIPFGQNEMIPTRPKKKSLNGSPDIETVVQASRTRVGATDILKWVGEESGITEHLHSSFPEGDAQKIETVAQYFVATDGRTIPHLEKWQFEHETPYRDGMSEDCCGRLFEDLAMNESGIQSYFSHRFSSCGTKRPIIALDTTSVDTYSANQYEFRYGFSKETGRLPSQKQLTIMAVENLQPIAFEQQPGNIPDVISIRNAIMRMQALGDVKPLVVTDNGFYSEDNCTLFVKYGISFLSRMSVKTGWIKEQFKTVQKNIHSYSNKCPFDSDTYGMTVKAEHVYNLVRERTRGKFKAGDTQQVTKNMYLHFFFSDSRGVSERAIFTQEIDDLINSVKSGTELTTHGERMVERYLIISKDDAGNVTDVQPNNDAINEHWEELGFFVLVSNSEKDTFDTLKYYRWRNRIENLYEIQKNTADGKRPRVWSPARLRGRQFVQFISASYYCFLSHRINELKQSLGQDDGVKSASEIKLEKSLLKWLNNVSISQMLEWFDAVTLQQIKSPYASKRITSETTKRDELFLRKLGILK
ncbi:IS1634 family transposase [Anaerobiospirillum succiniciproducens]|uniref:IS1634 family transposase n=1 Tax=Anaerobiospirillum succiniciproducens TaxID=13335 RepID=UPI003F8862C9